MRRALRLHAVASTPHALLAGLAMGAVACSAARPPAPPVLDAGRADGGASSGSVELGTGTGVFQPLAVDGGEIELVMGPQGGYHVEVAIRVRDLPLDGLAVTYTVVRTRDGAALSRTPYLFSSQRFVRDGASFVHTGDLAILSVTGPADVVGDTLELAVEVTPMGGLTHEDRRRAVVVDARP